MLFSGFVPFCCPVLKPTLGLPHLTKMRTFSNKMTNILITDRIGRHKCMLKTSNHNCN